MQLEMMGVEMCAAYAFAFGVRTPPRVVAPTGRVNQRGEGVISTAIAVLIIAFLGAGMWIAFQKLFDDTSDRTTRTVNEIGPADGGDAP